ncbi:hypothetical protein ACYSNR_17165 [Enterococcus sp. LJL128]
MEQLYVVEFQFADRSFFCLWYTDDTDGLIIEEGKLIKFDSIIELKAYVKEKKLSLGTGVTTYNIEHLEKQLENGLMHVDCEEVLLFWNISLDISNSLAFPFLGTDNFHHIYEKLFYGNNLPAINTSGEKYVPTWSGEEMHDIKNVVSDGVSILKKELLV